MRYVYVFLLWLYPPGYRHEFSAEMLHVLGQSLRNAPHGRSARLRFLLRECTGLIVNALRAWAVAAVRSGACAFALPFVVGSLISAVAFLPIYLVEHIRARVSQMSTAVQEPLLMLILASAATVMVAGCSVAFVANARWLAGRTELRGPTVSLRRHA